MDSGFTVDRMVYNMIFALIKEATHEIWENCPEWTQVDISCFHIIEYSSKNVYMLFPCLKSPCKYKNKPT